MSYEEKIKKLLEVMISELGIVPFQAISDVKTWLSCEWHCGNIDSMEAYVQLRDKVDDIAADIIKTL